ncbi:hypothetical protein RHHCN13_06640 [Rickettsia conorii subsp. heilongjiangensis]|uniref:Uncharacterized protein n=1 Tax=Rickettsia conorii subsp. heilongjiangensis TaxID=226665 RepID=A0AAD1LT63_RICCR|nr:hypothetical protein RHCH81_06640 [Rickettsia conorii subsp. heilongjiangensis]BBM93206.1 hypothetical protein RHHCN13_06640 [Rickettsia conorii subsp. heilongjiangensis]BBM94415.1 hypothetical protein RHSENDAI29_06640 [Rickettsia conorii subsp. heilongjiangensis]BBM95624.1 hypothetical protein RHSENDAI58_06640 [Rickettsia conorii subsp. heilongjiangensis]
MKIASSSQYSTEHEIKISEFVNEILSLRLKTGIDINNSTYIDDANYRKEILLKNFLEEFKKMILMSKKNN